VAFLFNDDSWLRPFYHLHEPVLAGSCYGDSIWLLSVARCAWQRLDSGRQSAGTPLVLERRAIANAGCVGLPDGHLSVAYDPRYLLLVHDVGVYTQRVHTEMGTDARVSDYAVSIVYGV